MVQNSFFDNSVGAAQVQPIAQFNEGQDLFSEAVVLNLTLRSMGTSRKLDDTQYEVDASKEKTTATKKICRSDELEAITKLIGEVRKWIKSRTVPTKIKGGMLIMRLQLVPAMYAYIEEAQAKLCNLVEIFIAKYPDLKWRDSLPASEGGLGSTYDASDYPDVDKLYDLFEIACVPMEMGAPGKLKAIDKLAYEKAAAACKADMDSAVESARDLLLTEAQAIFTHLQECLIPGADGKAKTFKNSLVPNALEWLSNFNFRDFGSPQELRDMVERAKQVLQGVTSDSLRKSDQLKASIGATVSTIKSAIDVLVINRPGRKISLNDEWGGDL